MAPADSYKGITIGDYEIQDYLGKGKIGRVYKAVRNTPYDILACKIIPEGALKVGWQEEIKKIAKLRGVPGVVPYHTHGTKHDKEARPFTYVLFDYIPGENLKQYLQSKGEAIDLAFIERLAEVILGVLYACNAEDIHHGDLHEKNILIREPDPRIPDSPSTIWISDFGYGGSHNKLQPKNDFIQFYSIISSLLGRLDPSALTSRDRILYYKCIGFFKKQLLESDNTQGKYVGNIKQLRADLSKMQKDAERESIAVAQGEYIKEPDDYLYAEALGYNVEEWKTLFVPEFLAARDLLSKNITLLTGARGCGKTMSFRRLTAYMDKVIGESSAIGGAEQFIGYYVNCRDLTEAFPWLPKNLNERYKQRILHFFHLAWLSEFCRTLSVYSEEAGNKFTWLDDLLRKYSARTYIALPVGSNILAHVRAFIENEKERCRTKERISGIENWAFARNDFLDIFLEALAENVPFLSNKPIFLFLDDYTSPTIPIRMQRILNPIIFKRRSNVFFKVSSESSNSFCTQGEHGKPLEINQDFKLIDLATESIHQDYAEKEGFLENIFSPRIDRHPHLKGKGLTLMSVLGRDNMSNNQLAFQMREHPTKAVVYHGLRSFVGMWTSDIRTMIKVLTDMFREANGEFAKGNFLISKKIQDKTYRTVGGELLVASESLADPTIETGLIGDPRKNEPYGKHLKDIVEAFYKVSRYELTKGELISNQGRKNPRQAFRLEITDNFNLPDNVYRYYIGLIRWHLFLQDWRGKSVRGMITPRLYLNRILIPFCNLTFSSHDNIHLSNEEFKKLLLKPISFPEYWKNKRAEENKHGHSQVSLFGEGKNDK